jgi:hypothetical protein
MILRPPYYKGKGCCLNPVARYGIPKYADSRLNPKVKGTPDFEKYWEEQIFRIFNGYQSGGTYITGRFYYYLNFNYMSTINGIITPDIVDLHHEISLLYEYAKSKGKNIIIGKARRKGISEFTHKAVIDYGYRFTYGYNAGIAAGLKDYALDFMTKWSNGDSLMPLELQTKTLISNNDEVQAGYEIQDENNQWIDKGTKNKIHVRTMFNNPNLFKGLYLNDVVAEECGEFPNLIEFYNATEDTLTDGDKQIGTMLFYGTAGNVNKGSKDYKYIWEHADEFNMIKFLAPATRMHKPNYGGATRNGEIIEQIPNLLLTHKKFELIGVEDEIAAKEFILKKSDKLAKSGNKKKYLEYKQNNPLEEKDMFRKTAVNEFDTEKLNDQEYIVSNSPKKYSRWKLDWAMDENTKLRKIPLQIIAKPATKEDKDETTFLILDNGHPLKGYWGLYSGGIDSYDQDTSKTSKSLGAMCVLIRANTIVNAPQIAPVAVICTRPKRKEMFYEMCLKLAVYYNLQGATLIDAAKPHVIKYFEENYGQQYLALRPKAFENSNSDQTHVHGILLTKGSRPKMVGLMDTAIYYNVDQIWFDELINQLQNFDEVEEGSDNDLADAYGIALMQAAAEEAPPSNHDDSDIDEAFNLHAGTFDRNGNYHHNVETQELKNDEQDSDLFGT